MRAVRTVCTVAVRARSARCEVTLLRLQSPQSDSAARPRLRWTHRDTLAKRLGAGWQHRKERQRWEVGMLKSSPAGPRAPRTRNSPIHAFTLCHVRNRTFICSELLEPPKCVPPNLRGSGENHTHDDINGHEQRGEGPRIKATRSRPSALGCAATPPCRVTSQPCILVPGYNGTYKAGRTASPGDERGRAGGRRRADTGHGVVPQTKGPK